MSSKKPQPDSIQHWLKTSTAIHWSMQYNKTDESDALLEQRVRRIKKLGVNLIILGGPHFIWDFVDYFDAIDDYHRRLATIVHDHGMRIITHHSAILSARIRSDKDLEYVPSGHTVPRPPRLGAPLWVDGANASEWAAVNARTGKKQYYERYYALVYCPNNRDYRKAYDRRVRAMMKTGMDGIMSDDYGMSYSYDICGCDACRAKYRKTTGFPFPDLNDPDICMNYENPAWRAWLKFRWQTTRDQLRHIKGVIGPNRILATCSNGSHAGFCHFSGTPSFMQIAGGLDLVTREVVFATEVFYAWRTQAASFAIDQAALRRTGGVFMPLYYPSSKDYLKFGVGASAAQGGRLWTSFETQPRFPIGRWQRDRQALFPTREPDADVGLAFSESTALHRASTHPDRYHNSFLGWGQMLSENSIPWRAVLDTDLDEGCFDGLKVLVLPNTGCLSDRAVRALRSFHRKGGSLILTHQTGLYDETGTRRPDFALSSLMRASYAKTEAGLNIPFIFREPSTSANAHQDYFGDNVQHPVLSNLEYTADHWAPQVIAMEKQNARVLATLKIPGHPLAPAVLEGSAGRILYISGKPGVLYCQPTMRIVSFDGEQPAVMRDRRVQEYGTLMLNCVRHLLGGRERMLVQGSGWYATRFSSNSRVLVHVLNLKAADVPDGTPLPTRQRLFSPDERISVPVRGETLDMKIKLPKRLNHCLIHTPMRNAPTKHRFRRLADGGARIRIPASRIGLYSILEFC